ncbi:MAG TPA: HAD-IB family phosphatase, partial [Vicinamibacterales bacterium]|nr:HAD-IB family phosphatase [Vicinamibacterales bacterium]
CDTWTPFMRYAVRRPRQVAGRVLLAPIAIGYRARLVSATTGRCMFARFGFIGMDAAAVRERGRIYARTVLPRLVRPSALARIEWHRAQGDDVVVVSASLDVYIGPWCEQHNLRYICTTLEERNGRLTGKYVDGDCCGTEKARRVQQHLDLRQYAVVYAYGDSGEDRELLALAHKKYYRWKEIARWEDVTAYNHSDR